MPMPMFAVVVMSVTTTGTKATVGGLIVRVGRIVAAAGHTNDFFVVIDPTRTVQTIHVGWMVVVAGEEIPVDSDSGRSVRGSLMFTSIRQRRPLCNHVARNNLAFARPMLELDIGDAGGHFGKQ